MVLDDGVQVAGADHRVAEGVTGPAGAARGRGPVIDALRPADVVVTAAVRHAPEFLHIDVDEVAGPFVFVAAHPFAGGAVDVGEPVQVAARQDGMHDRGGWQCFAPISIGLRR